MGRLRRWLRRGRQLPVVKADVPTRYRLDHVVTHEYAPRPRPVRGNVDLWREGHLFRLPFTVSGHEAYVQGRLPDNWSVDHVPIEIRLSFEFDR
jgi:hypothetical protein